MKLVLPESLEQNERLGKVTAGNSLSPAQRHVYDYRGYMRDYTRVLSNEAVAKREAACAPDNGRPRTELEAQLGKPRTGFELKTILSKQNASLVFEDSIAFPERILIRSWNEKTQELLTICAMEKAGCRNFL